MLIVAYVYISRDSIKDDVVIDAVPSEKPIKAIVKESTAVVEADVTSP